MSIVRLLAMLIVPALLAGCATVKTGPTGRAVSDQILAALTIEDAVAQLDIDSHVAGRVVDLHVRGLGNDMDYIQEVLEAQIRLAGGALAGEDATTELTLFVVVQGAGSDQEGTRWSIPIFLPSVQSGLTVSRIDIYNSGIQVNRARMWAYALDPMGEVLFTHGPVYQAHFVSNPELLGLTLGKRSDIPELKRHIGVAPVDVPDVNIRKLTGKR